MDKVQEIRFIVLSLLYTIIFANYVEIIELHPNQTEPSSFFSEESETSELEIPRSPEESRSLVKSAFKCPPINQFVLTQPHQHLTILSPNYPLQYPLDSTCRYFITSPVGTKMVMKCHVSLPHPKFQIGNPTKFKYCPKTGDSFIFSLNGHDNFAQYNSSLCGNFLMKSISVANKIAVGYTSGPKNIFSFFPSTRKFKCTVKVTKGGSTTGSAGATGTQTFRCGRRFQRQLQSDESRRKILKMKNDGRILGGMQAGPGEFPWRCALQVIKAGVVTSTCSCSILSNEWILSSVHCTINENTADVFIRVGTSTFRVGDPGALSVSDIRRHPNYGTAGPHGDISVLKLSQPIAYSPTVSPICISCTFDYDVSPFEKAPMTVSGWVEAPAGTFNLMSQQLTRQDQQICFGLTPPIDPNEICIIDPLKTMCDETGDSGSDADYFDPVTGSYYAAGIFTSSPCMTVMKPGIHQNINHYISWLRTQTGIDLCRTNRP